MEERLISHSNISVGNGEMAEMHAEATPFISASERQTLAPLTGKCDIFCTLAVATFMGVVCTQGRGEKRTLGEVQLSKHDDTLSDAGQSGTSAHVKFTPLGLKPGFVFMAKARLSSRITPALCK
ncbi:hypothetical protein NQZ68_032712 [Dissostichus eleginoides]|nr:hypothetical protein NQZ68_032712 [Dissostichus eleginoides]